MHADTGLVHPWKRICQYRPFTGYCVFFSCFHIPQRRIPEIRRFRHPVLDCHYHVPDRPSVFRHQPAEAQEHREALAQLKGKSPCGIEHAFPVAAAALRILLKLPETMTTLYFVGMTALSLIFYIPINKLAPKLGKKKLIVVAFVIFSLSYLYTGFLGMNCSFIHFMNLLCNHLHSYRISWLILFSS